MSSKDLARRSETEVFFAGTNITQSLKQYFISLTYTDNEEGETDDLQIKIEDSNSVWLEKWLNATLSDAAELEKEEVVKQYKVTAKGGVAIRSSQDTKSKSLGTLASGTIITADDISDGFIRFKHSVVEKGKTTEKTAYAEEKHFQPIYKTVDNQSTASVTQAGTTSDLNVGDEVTVSGSPQQSSYGTGSPGAAVSNYKGTITKINNKDKIPYPVHIGQLGWFSIDQVKKGGGTAVATAENADDEPSSKGLKIQASIIRRNWHNDGVDDKLECGQFELDSISASGPPATITIKGTSLPYSSTIRQTKKSKSWENYTLQGIANEIAETNDMTCMYLAEEKSYSRVEQYFISDIAFLQKLCQDEGFSLKITNNNIVIFDQAAYESKPIIRTIQRGKTGGYTGYKLYTSLNDKYTSCHVCYVDPEGQTIEATAYIDGYDEKKKNQCLEIRQKVDSVAEALQLAKKSLRLHNKFEFMGEFTFPGEPELLAGCTVALEGWGAWDATYIIKKAKHTVSETGYTTQITIRRVMV